ncbi:MAG: cupin domain-containing protein [Gammaproteobacteria bacterium]|nr:cupin domain-containing protein [Gammaproteobacteria bacterium]
MLLGLIAVVGGARAESPPSSIGASFVGRSGFELRVLLDQSNLGSDEVELAELLFPAGTDSGDHAHGVVEIFYVLSGELEHVVNGNSTLLKPGMVGFVRPPDQVRHRTTAETRVLVIWVPGGEAARIIPHLQRRETGAADRKPAP